LKKPFIKQKNPQFFWKCLKKNRKLSKSLNFTENIFKIPRILKKKPCIVKKSLAAIAALPQWPVRPCPHMQLFDTEKKDKKRRVLPLSRSFIRTVEGQRELEINKHKMYKY
jgi:hypothetical protein